MAGRIVVAGAGAVGASIAYHLALLGASDVNRVEATTDVENYPEQRSLEKAGFVREGVARGSQWRGGAFHDMVTYSRLRTDRD